MSFAKNYIPFMVSLSECVDSLTARDIMELEHLPYGSASKAKFIATTFAKISDAALQQCFKLHSNSTAYVKTIGGSTQKIIASEYLSAEDAAAPTAYDKEHMIWYIDPIAGILNYEHRNHNCCFSMALTNAAGEGICSMLYMPFNNNFLYAQRHKGLYIRRMDGGFERASIAKHSMRNTLIIATNKAALSYLAKHKKIGKNSLNMLGCIPIEIALTAVGQLDIAVHHGIQTIDLMPGKLMLEEAGGVLNTTISEDGSSFNTVAGNANLVAQL